jgi:type IV secretory pathway VirB10-like protein
MPRLVYSEYSGLSYRDNSWSARAHRVVRALWIIAVAAAIGGIGGGSVALTLLHLTGGLPRQQVAGAAGEQQSATVAAPPAAARPPRIAAASSAAAVAAAAPPATAPPVAVSAAAPTVTAPPAGVSTAASSATAPRAAVQHAAASAALSPSLSADQQPRIASANKSAATEPVDDSRDAQSAASATPDQASVRPRALAPARRYATRTNRPNWRALAENARSHPRPPHYGRTYDRYERAYDEAKRSRYSQNWASGNWGGGGYGRPGGWGGGGYWRPGGLGGGSWGD